MDSNYQEKSLSKVKFKNKSEVENPLFPILEESLSATPSSLSVTGYVLNEIFDSTFEIVHSKQRLVNQEHRKDVGLFDLTDLIPTFEIDDQMYESLTFRENLIIGNLNDSEDLHPVPVGGICIDVQKAEGTGKHPEERLMEIYEKKMFQLLDDDGPADHLGNPKDWEDLPLGNVKIPAYSHSKMLVHVSSQLDYKGRNGGSIITSWVDRNLHTLEELRREFIIEEEDVNEKSLFMALKNKWYYVKHTSIPDFVDNRKLYSKCKARDYISEGANIILQRYLAISRYIGAFELAAAYINGDLCRNIYECYGPVSMIVNGRTIDGCQIKRTIIEECGIKHIAITDLTLTGHILKLQWNDCPYVCYVNPEIDPNIIGCYEDSLLKDDWEKDLELLSTYLDKKNNNSKKIKSLLDRPELENILQDYVRPLLSIRQCDIMNYTMKYFDKFLPSDLPQMDYFHN